MHDRSLFIILVKYILGREDRLVGTDGFVFLIVFRLQLLFLEAHNMQVFHRVVSPLVYSLPRT